MKLGRIAWFEEADFQSAKERGMEFIELDVNDRAELFLENKDNLLQEIDCLTASLLAYRQAIAENDRKTLIALLDDGRKRKEEVDGK